MQIVSRKFTPHNLATVADYKSRADATSSQANRSGIRRPTELTDDSDPDHSNGTNASLVLHDIREMLHEEMTKVLDRPHSAGHEDTDQSKLYNPEKAYMTLRPIRRKSIDDTEQASDSDEPAKPDKAPDSDGAQLSQFFHEELLMEGTEHAGRGGIRYEEVVFPRNLQEAEPRSLRLLCGGFSRMSPVRIKCFEIYQSPVWNTFFVLVSVVNAFVIAIAPQYVGNVQAQAQNPYEQATASLNSHVERLVGFSGLQIFDYACVGLLGAEIAAGCIAVGLVSVRSSWLRCSDLHKVELFVLLSACGEYVGAYFGFRSLSLRPLLLVRVLKPILRFGTFVGIRVMLAALDQVGLPIMHDLSFAVGVSQGRPFFCFFLMQWCPERDIKICSFTQPPRVL